MQSLRPAHYVAFGMFLTGLAAQMNGVHAWSEVYSPSFVSGVVLNAGGLLITLFSDKPRSPDAQTRASDPKE